LIKAKTAVLSGSFYDTQKCSKTEAGMRTR